VLIPHLIVWYLYPNTIDVPNLPTWIMWLNGILFLAYFNFDNCDGKQARKTKSSSPLGLLFDHGVDAQVVFI